MGSCVANESYIEVLRRRRRKTKAAGLPMHTFLSWKTTSGCIATREASVAIAADVRHAQDDALGHILGGDDEAGPHFF